MKNNNRSRNFNQKDDKGIRTNGDVRYPEVRLLDSDRQLIGIMSSRDAMFKAKEAGLDLIELSPTAKPPVCFLGMADKHIYEVKKKEKENKKKSKGTQTKEIQIRPNIAENDAIRKLAEADKFLSKGNRVRVVMKFRGRERGRIFENAEKLTNLVLSHIENGKMEGVAPKPQPNSNQHAITLFPHTNDKKEEVQSV